MKNFKISMAAMLLLVVSFSQAQEKEKMNHDHNKMEMNDMSEKAMALEFKDEAIARSYKDYIYIKNALVKSDVNEAQIGAKMMGKSLRKVENADIALNVVGKIEATTDIKEQRSSFSKLSNEIENLIKGEIKAGKIYKDFCPMALNGGAYWLSTAEEIQNPYFGSKMLKCGSVKNILQ